MPIRLASPPRRFLLAAALLCAAGCSSGAGADHEAGVARSTDGGAGEVGASCLDDTDCSQGAEAACLTPDAGFPSGYCASSCTPDGGCPGGDPCVTGVFVNNQGDPVSACLESCTSNGDCRSGYNCLGASGQSFCWPFCKASSDCLDSNETCDTDTGLCSPAASSSDAGAPPDGGPAVVTIPLSGCAIVGYSVPVTIGGSQTFAMSLDTGSTTTGVAGATCSDCGVSPEYTPGADASNTGQPTSSQYGSGAWEGEVYEDTVQVDPEMPAVSMYFADITSQREFFLNSDCAGNPGELSQGILGMGPLDLDTIGMIPGDAYFSDLVQAASLPYLFAVQLCSLGGGSLWLGGFDTSVMTAAPQYTPIVPLSATAQPFYAVTLLDVGLGGASLGATDYGPSIVDTGTYGFLMPDDAYAALINSLSASAAVTQVFGANTINTDFFNNGNCVSPTGMQTPAEIDAALPPLTMTFPTAAGGSFTLTMAATSSYLIPIPFGGTTCYIAGAGSSDGIGATIIGAAVQASHITIFDPQDNQIGFATARGCP